MRWTRDCSDPTNWTRALRSFVRSLVGSQPRLHARVKDRCLKYDEDDIEIVLDDYEAIARSVSRDRIK